MSDKTEDPTPRRLAKAREKGDVAVSGAASQALGFVVAVALVPGAIAATAAEASGVFRRVLGNAGNRGPALFAATTDVALGTVHTVAAIIAPLLLAVAAVNALATVVQTGGLFAPARVKPDLAKLDPISGFRSLVSGQRLWNVARALLAAIAVGFLAWRALVTHLPDLAHTVGWPPGAVDTAVRAAKRMAKGAAAVGLFLGVIDLVVSRRSFLSRLRMSKAEIKQEHRESEGDPHWKGARQRAHQEMLASATVNAVKNATVVVVNPEHLATALRYVDGEDEAPTVLATGDGALALRIQEAARAYGVPIVRDVPVARALRELEAGDTIPEALYEAVAAILDEVWAAEEKRDAT
ncbi:MAG: EscU/YscU/HrcU family type III secretion system export apparatus switch protein [Polyangiaceae bacterium]